MLWSSVDKFVLLGLLCFITFCSSEVSISGGGKRILIIGGGLGGLSTAKFLRNLLGEEAEIFVLERNSYLGGRIRTLNIHGKHVELGASIYHIANRYISELAKGLPTKYINSTDTFSMWNGKEITFSSSTNNMWTIASLIFQYYLSPYFINNAADEVATKFGGIYSILDHGTTFKNLTKLVKKLDLEKETQHSFLEYTKKYFSSWGMESFIENIAAGATRCNYNQDVDVIHALGGFVSVYAERPALRAVSTGNSEILKTLAAQSSSYILKSTKVTRIEKVEVVDENGDRETQYKVDFNNQKKAQSSEMYDFVVMAAPIEGSGVQFINVASVKENGNIKNEQAKRQEHQINDEEDDDANESVKLEREAELERELDEEMDKQRPEEYRREFRTTHVTLVVGLPDPSFFNLPEFPGAIFTSRGEQRFSSFAAVSDKINGTEYRVYKIFSRERVSDELLGKLFFSKTYVFRHVWKAYTVLHPNAKYPPIQLDENIFYLNAFESVLSVMEGSIMAAKNIALLITKTLAEKTK